MFSISNNRLSVICYSPAHSCFDKVFVVYLSFFFLCCEPEQRETNLRYDSSRKTSEIKEHKQAEQQQSSFFSSSTTSPNVSKMFAQQNKRQRSASTKRNTRMWGEWAARWLGEVRTVCSVIQSHQSMCFCSQEHIPWILLGFVPLNLQPKWFRPCRAEWGGPVYTQQTHDDKFTQGSFKQYILVLLASFYWFILSVRTWHHFFIGPRGRNGI